MQFEPKEKEYNQYVETITPVSNSARNCLWAFLIGGLICTIGQVLFNLFEYVKSLVFAGFKLYIFSGNPM